jgi:hypothetical protein
MNELFSITEVSTKLKISRELAYKLVGSGLLRAIKIGTMKVSQKELDHFIDKYYGMDLSDFNDVKQLAPDSEEM